MAMAANFTEDDEWEVVDTGDFIYKRQKRDPSAPSSSSSVPPPPPATPSDPELERKNRRKRKKSTLLKIRESYQTEIHQWEHLSNTLCALQQNSAILQLPEHQPIHGGPSSSGQSSSENLPVSTPRELIDELLLQAEAQEAIIEDAVNLCEMAEAVFRKKEKQFKLQLSSLPVWTSSPRALILSLCDD